MRRFWALPSGVLAVALAFVLIIHAGQADRLASAQAELSALRGSLSSNTAQITYRDPTYGELMQFLKTDETDNHIYNPATYDCKNFVADLNLAAESQGYRAAFVSIKFTNGSHALSAFNTADRGLVYVEPQLDRTVTLDVGQSYSQSNGLKLATASHDDTIERVTVIW